MTAPEIRELVARSLELLKSSPNPMAGALQLQTANMMLQGEIAASLATIAESLASIDTRMAELCEGRAALTVHSGI
jgi:hypothetical protein